MFSKYLALVLVALQVAYAAPTTGTSQAGCSPSYPGGFGISVTPIRGKLPRAGGLGAHEGIHC